eukprot:CAMPEP_0196581824 /NCGR_PEP_ID=MMETSP1081-20130531/35849_1 /TAXON_ID=36882 /ORGANISM="Pyramimonas amylifera, Strain CCMP720" /LENGTH=34 /DNA_ID= /DNA_START= /DNA_END= /DNA_ORIENTATION=
MPREATASVLGLRLEDALATVPALPAPGPSAGSL